MKLTDKQKLALFATTNSFKIQPYLDLYEADLLTFEDFSKKVILFAEEFLTKQWKDFDNVLKSAKDDPVKLRSLIVKLEAEQNVNFDDRVVNTVEELRAYLNRDDEEDDDDEFEVDDDEDNIPLS